MCPGEIIASREDASFALNAEERTMRSEHSLEQRRSASRGTDHKHNLLITDGPWHPPLDIPKNQMRRAKVGRKNSSEDTHGDDAGPCVGN